MSRSMSLVELEVACGFEHREGARRAGLLLTLKGITGKGKNRPINTFADRAKVIGALEWVDYVVGFEEADPEQLIHKIRPDVLIKGEDWAQRGVKGRELVESTGGRVVLLPLVKGFSTTAMIERIRQGE